MIAEKISHIVNPKSSSKTILNYHGPFNDIVTEQSIDELEQKLNGGHRINVKITKRIIYLFVEQIQNIIRHGAKEQNQTSPEGQILVELNEGNCQIKSYNYCDSSKSNEFISKIHELNDLTHEEIKLKYRHHLEQNTFSTKGGAGLGLLDMRRRTKNKLVTELFNVENKEVFGLTITINLR